MVGERVGVSGVASSSRRSDSDFVCRVPWCNQMDSCFHEGCFMCQSNSMLQFRPYCHRCKNMGKGDDVSDVVCPHLLSNGVCSVCIFLCCVPVLQGTPDSKHHSAQHHRDASGDGRLRSSCCCCDGSVRLPYTRTCTGKYVLRHSSTVCCCVSLCCRFVADVDRSGRICTAVDVSVPQWGIQCVTSGVQREWSPTSVVCVTVVRSTPLTTCQSPSSGSLRGCTLVSGCNTRPNSNTGCQG